MESKCSEVVFEKRILYQEKGKGSLDSNLVGKTECITDLLLCRRSNRKKHKSRLLAES